MLIGNPVIVVVVMNLLGFKRKTAFMTGLTMAQISEFSLILASLGFSVGHLNRDTLSLVTLVGLVTIALSSYLIIHAEKIYPALEKIIKKLEIVKSRKGKGDGGEGDFDFVLFGYDRVGSDFIKAFNKLKRSFLVVDYNPQSINRLESEGLPAMYGDAGDAEFLEEINLVRLKLCVSTIPDVNVNKFLIEKIREVNRRGIVIVVSHDVKEAKVLYQAGANYVVMPHYLGARVATKMIRRFGVKRSLYEKEKEKHEEYLNKRMDYQDIKV